MSKISLKSSSSGTATFTIESPATNTDRTLVLPDVAGTVALTSQIPAAPTIASTGEAQAGTNNTNFLTPLRLREGFNATGSAPVFACRAFVNFNGTGTVAIRASGNVSSITDNGIGNYTINFSTPMPDNNFAIAGAGGVEAGGGSNNILAGIAVNSQSNTNVNIFTIRGSQSGGFDALTDSGIVCVHVFR